MDAGGVRVRRTICFIQLKHMSLVRTFCAGHIATSLGDAVTVDLHDAPSEAAATLRRQRFDQAPVRDGRHIVGWVPTQGLDGATRVGSILRPLRDSAIASTDAPLADVLELLAREDFVFTVGNVGLAGFVTPSDLDRHAARSHFYLLVSDVEMALAEVVRHAVPRDRIIELIRGETLVRWKTATAANNEANPVEYLHIRALAELFLETRWGGLTSEEARNTLTELCQFRPIVMHPARQLTAGRSPAALASLARRSEALVGFLDQVVQEATGSARWQ